MSLQGGILFFIVMVDTFVTGYGISAGYLKELNPLALWLMDNAGMFLFIMFKAMFVLLLVAHLDRKLNGDETVKRMANRTYKIAIVFYAGYFVLPWIAANHDHIRKFFH